MTYDNLVSEIHSKKSFLCVGLDSDISKIPKHLLDFEDPIFEFNKQIIDATKEFCIAYKPNIAFYEAMGPKGWTSLKKTIDYIPDNIFTIADAKRGDIGNTAKMYAKTYFDTYDFDSVTVAPYMGEDSVVPFLEFKDKWTILLGLTSNKGNNDFQMKGTPPLFETVLSTAQNWGDHENLMFVVGATNDHLIQRTRELASKNFFLVPGVGAQGGSMEDVIKYGRTDDIGLLINSSRGIIYAGEDKMFAEAAFEACKIIQKKMKIYI